jgi:hypothetical protein
MSFIIAPKTIKFNYDSINSALPSVFCGWVVLLSKCSPVSEMRMAPVGAVKTILKMHTINTISAYGRSGSSASKCFSATGPRAACTVALALTAMAVNTCE